MKKLRLFFVTVIAVLFVSCYEVTEDIVINENGSGTYQTRMDMGQLLELMQTMGGEDELAKEGLDRAIDTVINMGSVMDSAKDVSAEQKQLLKDGKIHLNMNVKEKLMKLDVNLPFKDYGNLQKLMSGMANSGTGIGEAFKSMFDKGDGDRGVTDMPAQPKTNQMDALNGIYDVIVKNGTVSRKINPEKFRELMAKPEMAQMKEVASSGMEILYTTNIKVPRAIKKSDNPLLKLSADKKTATLRYNLLEIFETPEKFSYSIEY